MVRIAKNYHLALKGSTLVEVLVSMVILLTIFALGMVIFTRIISSSKSHSQQQTHSRLKEIRSAYEAQDWNDKYEENESSVSYRIEEEEFLEIKDRIKVKIFAINNSSQKLIDSLIFLKEIDE